MRRRVVYQLWLKKRRVSQWFTRQATCSRCKHTATALACRYWYVYLSPLVSNARAVPPPPFRPIPGAGGTRSMYESLPTPSSTCFVPTICEGRVVPEDNLERASRDLGKEKTSPTVIFVENHPSVDSAFVLFIHCFCLFCRATFNLAPTYSRVQGRAQYRYLCRKVSLSSMPSRWETRGCERADTAVRCSRYNGPGTAVVLCVRSQRSSATRFAGHCSRSTTNTYILGLLALRTVLLCPTNLSLCVPLDQYIPTSVDLLMLKHLGFRLPARVSWF